MSNCVYEHHQADEDFALNLDIFFYSGPAPQSVVDAESSVLLEKSNSRELCESSNKVIIETSVALGAFLYNNYS